MPHMSRPTRPRSARQDQRARGYKEEYTEKRIGNVVRKILGFETERRGHDRNYWVIWNKENEENKRSYYGITSSKATSASSESSAEDTQDITKEAQDIFDA